MTALAALLIGLALGYLLRPIRTDLVVRPAVQWTRSGERIERGVPMDTDELLAQRDALRMKLALALDLLRSERLERAEQRRRAAKLGRVA